MTVRVLYQTLITLLKKPKNVFSDLQEKLLLLFFVFIRLNLKKGEISVCTIYSDFLAEHPVLIIYSLGWKVFISVGPRMQWYCRLNMKNSVLDSVISWQLPGSIGPKLHIPRTF